MYNNGIKLAQNAHFTSYEGIQFLLLLLIKFSFIMEEKGINNKIKNMNLATDPLLRRILSNFFL